jgi:hypothetical protein
MFQRTVMCLRKARITIPQLSPTHTQAKISKWCLPVSTTTSHEVQEYDALMVLECSADLVTPGYRESENHQPIMIIDVQEEGTLKIDDDIELDKWYLVGHPIGEIDDGDDDGDHSDWLWQANGHSEEEQKD